MSSENINLLISFLALLFAGISLLLHAYFNYYKKARLKITYDPGLPKEVAIEKENSFTGRILFESIGNIDVIVESISLKNDYGGKVYVKQLRDTKTRLDLRDKNYHLFILKRGGEVGKILYEIVTSTRPLCFDTGFIIHSSAGVDEKDFRLYWKA